MDDFAGVANSFDITLLEVTPTGKSRHALSLISSYQYLQLPRSYLLRKCQPLLQ